MVGKKRASEDSGPTTRQSKAAKTDNSTTPKSSKGGKRGPKANLPVNTFKSRALPLHVNITHTPPSVPEDDTAADAPIDTGFLGTATLVPSSFATGSYGWKGSKRLTIELQNGEGDEKEKVQVMLTINATVIGSKGAPEEEEKKEEKKEEEKQEEAAKEENGEKEETKKNGKEADKSEEDKENVEEKEPEKEADKVEEMVVE